MSPTPNDMPRRLRLKDIPEIPFAPTVVGPQPTWAKDLRWQRDDIYAHIKSFRDMPNKREMSPGLKDWMTEVMIEVRFDGYRFFSRQWVDEVDPIPLILDAMVDSIDNMMAEHGFPPYNIRSTNAEEAS
jgi:hypothetical protein